MSVSSAPRVSESRMIERKLAASRCRIRVIEENYCVSADLRSSRKDGEIDDAINRDVVQFDP